MPGYKLQKPVLVITAGIPGAGKSYVSRKLSQLTGMAHLNKDELTAQVAPQLNDFSQSGLLSYMYALTDKFLLQGASVIADIGPTNKKIRQALHGLAANHNVPFCVVWVQTDVTTAYKRASSRDRRKIDDRYSHELSREEFDKAVRHFTKPQENEVVVISGKHDFKAQFKAIRTKFIQLEVMSDSLERTLVKPRPITPDPKRKPNQFQHRKARLQ